MTNKPYKQLFCYIHASVKAIQNQRSSSNVTDSDKKLISPPSAINQQPTCRQPGRRGCAIFYTPHTLKSDPFFSQIVSLPQKQRIILIVTHLAMIANNTQQNR